MILVNSFIKMGTHLLYLYSVYLMSNLICKIACTTPNIDYSHNMRILKIPRETQKGSLIYRLKGSSPLPVPIYFGVRESMGERLLDIKSSGFRTADVYLRSTLDKSEYHLTIFVSDGSQSTEVKSTIITTCPEGPLISPFINFQPLYSIYENAIHNTTVGSLTVKEKESSNLPAMFELKGSDRFAMRYVFGPKGASKAEIILVKPVDYEKENLYSLTILAINVWTNETIDTRNVATVDVLVAIKDVEDTAPKFIDLPSVVHIPIDLPTNDTIVSIKAEDGDYGINRKMEYSLIKGPLNTHFLINKTTGNLGLRTSIENLREEVGFDKPFILSIQASEIVEEENVDPDVPRTSVAQVAFILVALENRPPVFASQQLHGFIEENSAIMTNVRWKSNSIPSVSDPDSGINGTFSLFVDNNKMFMIQPNRGTKELMFAILLKNADGLDYEASESKEINLKITAQDHSRHIPLSSSINCKINIIDVNDNHPQFSETVYNVSLHENAEIGTKLVQVKATDKDTNYFGQIVYTSLNGPIAENLNLDPKTGVITLSSLDGIDREQISEYTLTVEARDENGFGHKNVSQIKVKILDANDNEPRFVQSRYDTILNPDHLTFTQPLVVQAYDADEPDTANSRVTYEIIDGNYQGKFEINNVTGEIRIKSPLTFQQSETKLSEYFQKKDSNLIPSIVLTIRAHDNGIPYRYSTVKVYLHNKDFLNRTVSFVVHEKAYQVRARKEEIERGLKALTGAEVHIYNVRENKANINSQMSFIDAWMAYPVHSTIDLTNLPSIASEIIGKQAYLAQANEEIQTASIARNDYDLIVWILLALILLTVAFLIVFSLIWCLCLKPKEKDEKTRRFASSRHSADSHDSVKNSHTFARSKRASSPLVDSAQLVSKNEHEVNEKHRKKSPIYIKDHGLVDRRFYENGDKSDKFRRIKLNKNQRVRVAPEFFEEDRQGFAKCYEDNNSDYYLIHKDKFRLIPEKHLEHSDYSANVDKNLKREDDYQQTMSGHSQYYDKDPRLRRIDMNYSKSGFIDQNVLTSNIYNERSDVEKGIIKGIDKAEIEISQGQSSSKYVIQDSNKKNVELSSESENKKQVTFPDIKLGSSLVKVTSDPISEIEEDTHNNESSVVHTSSSEKMTIREKAESTNPERDDSAVVNSKKQEDELLKEITKPLVIETFPLKRSSSNASQFDLNFIDRVVSGDTHNEEEDAQVLLKSSNSGSENEKKTQEIIKSLSKSVKEVKKGDQSDSSDKSDSDSGIGRTRLEKELNLKNSQLMTKKSIFTIAFDGVKTKQIPSLESTPSSPLNLS